jgi:hypothetical protein
VAAGWQQISIFGKKQKKSSKKYSCFIHKYSVKKMAKYFDVSPFLLIFATS